MKLSPFNNIPRKQKYVRARRTSCGRQMRLLPCQITCTVPSSATWIIWHGPRHPEVSLFDGALKISTLSSTWYCSPWTARRVLERAARSARSLDVTCNISSHAISRTRILFLEIPSGPTPESSNKASPCSKLGNMAGCLPNTACIGVELPTVKSEFFATIQIPKSKSLVILMPSSAHCALTRKYNCLR